MTEEGPKLASLHRRADQARRRAEGPVDGLCDFPSLRDGRPVYLCWRLGEPQVLHWHELNAGVAGRQLLNPGPVKSGHRNF